MFGNKKKEPVLTATTCNVMENLRLAVEVLTGKPVRFIQIDFNTNRGKIRVGEEEKDIAFYSQHSDRTNFFFSKDVFDKDEVHYFVRSDKPGEVRVIIEGLKRESSYLKDDYTWAVGRSFVHRWEEPLCPNN